MEDRTIEELENEYWDEPEFQSGLATTCHRLRKKRLSEFTPGDLRIMIGQQTSLTILMPLAIAVLNEDALAEGDYYSGDLLKVALESDSEWHQAHPALARQLAGIARKAVKQIHADPDQFPPTDDLTTVLLETLERYFSTYS